MFKDQETDAFFKNLFDKYLQSARSVPGSVLDTGIIAEPITLAPNFEDLHVQPHSLVMSQGPRDQDQPAKFESCLPHLPAVCPLAAYLTSLNLSCHVYKLRVRKAPLPQ